MILERSAALALVSHLLALHFHRTWLAGAVSAPPITMPSASSAAGAEMGSIDVERFDPNGGEMIIAAASRKAVRSPQRRRGAAELRCARNAANF